MKLDFTKQGQIVHWNEVISKGDKQTDIKTERERLRDKQVFRGASHLNLKIKKKKKQ